ncbi:MAG: aldo/keto reductase [Anaerovoracaceae bacterium]|jgi:predicted aldo/keto reductase-like oxidoreductase/quercetin dioxygenase-like cupin family protein
MGFLGEDIRKLGFGLMRLPKKDGAIDLEQTKKMVDRFLEEGFTYFDTAWAYEGSEEAIRKALVERYPRDSFQLATKNAAWINCKTADEAKKQFDVSLERTGAGYFDFYLLHNLGETRTKIFDDFGIWDFLEEKKRQGLIRHLGFSFHSNADDLEQILGAHPETEFVQLQINYGDWENPAVESRRCYETARAHGVPIIIMEPVKGGMLATPPEEVQQLFREAEPEASCASWALRFAADLDGIITVLSGMSSLEQMEDNLAVMKSFHGLTEKERGVIAQAQQALAKIPLIPCTTCDYCAKVCPCDIGISGSFTAMNMLLLYGSRRAAIDQTGWLIDGHGRKPAGDCIKCGRCEQACPQHISIRSELERVRHALVADVTIEDLQKNSTFPVGGENTEYARYFQGTSYLNMLSLEQVPVGNVTFSPGCRNNWHIHHAAAGGGQMLLVTAGRGWYQEWGKEAQPLMPGEVIHIPPNVKHWHGAARDTAFQHLAVEVPGEETSTEWCEAVSDEEYEKLTD